MKFGKNLEGNKVPEFSLHYINYKGLKKLIKQCSTEGSEPERSKATAFFFELDRSVEDIDAFNNKRAAEIRRRIGLLERRYNIGPSSDLNKLNLPSDEWEELVTAMLDLRSSLQKLLWFSEVNKQGIVKILKKLEKKLPLVVKDTYLASKVNHLAFATPNALQNDLHKVNSWLAKVVPADLNNQLKETTHAEDNMKRVKSFVHMGLQEDVANVFENLITSDDDEALGDLLTSTRSSLTSKVLANLLQQALLRPAFRCARIFLEAMDTLTTDDDINERSVIQKLIIVQGRRICKTLDGTHGSPLADEMWITPAIAPVPNLTIGNPALDFGSRLRDSISQDDPAALKFLLENMKITLRPFIDHRDAHQRLPLHYAAEYGLEKCTQVLISYMLSWGYLRKTENLEDPRFADSDGMTPVHLSVKHKYPVTLNILLRALNDDNSKVLDLRRRLTSDRDGINPLTLAIGSPNIISILVNAGMNINYQDVNGETCLHVAARQGDAESLREFLRPNDLQQADLQLVEKLYGWTPLFVAAIEGHEEALSVLASACRNLDQVDLSGWTAMEHAIFRGHIHCGKMLQPQSPPGPRSTFDRFPRGKLFKNSDSTEDALAKGTKPKDVEETTKIVKTFGHRYLKDRCMIIVTLGCTDTRRQTSPVKLDKVPIADVGTTLLDTALSLVVSAKNADGDATVFDLPLADNPTTEPMLFTAKDPDQTQLYFDIVPTYAATGSKKLGRAVAMLSTIKTKIGAQRASLWGSVTIPIIEADTLSVIGTVEFEFSVVTPFQHPQMSIEKESTYWKSLMSTRVIGHRGLGKNTNLPDRRSLQLGENTVQSFVAAANLGASYVEFDVQITKDLVPVLYHDFLVSQTGIDAPVHALTLDQFMSAASVETPAVSRGVSPSRNRGDKIRPSRSRSMSSKEMFDSIDRMKHTRDFKMHGFKGNQRGHSVQEAFSTLAEVFKKVPKTVGFNIECKYPMLSEAEDEEMDHTALEINQWVDTVLQCVYDHCDGRDIIFSSFHPDICLLLALKQPTIPCLFLTEAGTTRMCDVRAASLQEAIRFASRWNLLGIVSACEPFILCPRLVRVVKESGLVCVSYGSMNNDPANVNAQVTAGVDAVIVDSVLAIRKGLTSGELATDTTRAAHGIVESTEDLTVGDAAHIGVQNTP